MNEQRRKDINAAIEQLTKLHEEVQRLRDEEQDYYDAMPENMQGGDKGQAAEQVVSVLDSAYDSVQSAIDELQAAVEG